MIIEYQNAKETPINFLQDDQENICQPMAYLAKTCRGDTMLDPAIHFPRPYVRGTICPGGRAASECGTFPPLINENWAESDRFWQTARRKTNCVFQQVSSLQDRELTKNLNEQVLAILIRFQFPFGLLYLSALFVLISAQIGHCG